MYEMKRTVNCSQIGSHGIIRNSCLVDLLQDCSVIHLDTHPVMSPFFEKENCVMFLVSRQLDIVRRPEQNEKLTVKTWTYELKRMREVYSFWRFHGQDLSAAYKSSTGAC